MNEPAQIWPPGGLLIIPTFGAAWTFIVIVLELTVDGEAQDALLVKAAYTLSELLRAVELNVAPVDWLTLFTNHSIDELFPSFCKTAVKDESSPEQILEFPLIVIEGVQNALEV